MNTNTKERQDSELPTMLTPEEARHVLHVGTTMIYRLLHSGELPAQRAGYRWLISRDRLIEWMNGEWVNEEAAARRS